MRFNERGIALDAEVLLPSIIRLASRCSPNSIGLYVQAAIAVCPELPPSELHTMASDDLSVPRLNRQHDEA